MLMVIFPGLRLPSLSLGGFWDPRAPRDTWTVRLSKAYTRPPGSDVTRGPVDFLKCRKYGLLQRKAVHTAS